MADATEEFVVSRTFEGVNPCTGLEHEITLTFQVREHHHRNNDVATVKGTASTSDGYDGRASETDVRRRDGLLILHANWMNVNDETGGRYQVRERLHIDTATDEVVVDGFEIRCVTQPR